MPTSRRSSSGRRRSRSAATARTIVCRSRSGWTPGRRSPAESVHVPVSVDTARESRATPRAARISAALWRRPWLRAALTLSPALTWFLVIYLASLVVMLITAFWSVDPFTNNLQHQLTLDNFRQLFTPTYEHIIWRTVVLAALVTLTDAVLALPFAY